MRTIVIGVDGLIGSELARALTRRGDTVQKTTRRAVKSVGDLIHLDLAALRAEKISFLPDADVAFFCAGITSFAECRNNPDMARRVNVVGPTALARRLAAAGTKVILLSTSAVFDWNVPHVPASAPRCPVSVYGALKAEAEEAFEALGAQASIVRFSKVLAGHDRLFASWLAGLKQRAPVTAYIDHHMAPLTLDDAVRALLTVSDSSATGVFQLSGANDISYFDAAHHLASIVGIEPELVLAASAREYGVPSQEIIRFSSLDTTRIGALMRWGPPDPYTVLDTLFGGVNRSGFCHEDNIA